VTLCPTPANFEFKPTTLVACEKPVKAIKKVDIFIELSCHAQHTLDDLCVLDQANYNNIIIHTKFYSNKNDGKMYEWAKSGCQLP
jgi:hypothetical protein